MKVTLLGKYTYYLRGASVSQVNVVPPGYMKNGLLGCGTVSVLVFFIFYPDEGNDIPPKCWFMVNPHDATSQKTVFFIFAAVKTSNSVIRLWQTEIVLTIYLQEHNFFSTVSKFFCMLLRLSVFAVQ
jgi:hypothetical protein